ncbi:unnamed protein product [Ostreobium quekettii]|uniref:Uncharacterized protein n=1 Tax=Ostreobium quekettii TaxID=121088 RepID=A0A8S1JG11_9CHLO|nr:unnamed protein product [Ostreobium quekettii]
MLPVRGAYIHSNEAGCERLGSHALMVPEKKVDCLCYVPDIHGVKAPTFSGSYQAYDQQSALPRCTSSTDPGQPMPDGSMLIVGPVLKALLSVTHCGNGNKVGMDFHA